MSWGKLVGERFGTLTVLDRVENSKHNERMWRCKCDCGDIVYISTSDLRTGKKKCPNCGHRQYRLIGKRFGRLTVISKYKTEKPGTYWKCQCDCGSTKIVKGDSLVNGKTKSCGCLSREINRTRLIKHGMQKTRIYRIWCGMKSRCYYKKDVNYKHYGGRGITICDEWLGENGFINFKDWAFANGYTEELTIDRIDVDGNYEPRNCRWITQREQINNRRNTIFLTLNEETHDLSTWADLLNVPRRVLYWRKTHGWKDIETLTTPIHGKEKVNE